MTTAIARAADLDAAGRLLTEVDHVVPHTDADGLASGAIALKARGEYADRAVLLERGRTPFGSEAPLPEGSVAVLDWGVRSLSRSGLIVDHHAPEADPRRDQLVVSAYGRPDVSTSSLMREIVPAAPIWLAALGAYGDLGDAGLAALPPLEGPKSHVKKLTALINAPRRVPEGPVRTALAILVEAESPRAALADERTEALEACRLAFKEALDAAKRVGPRVEDGLALIRLSSAFQVHPVVATVWSRRLSPNLVMAANDSYLDGRVNFAVRGGRGDLRALLRAALPEGRGEFAHGHDRATGGSLPPDQFELLVKRLRESPA